MKLLLPLLLFLSACTKHITTTDASAPHIPPITINDVYIEHKYTYIQGKYLPTCLGLCAINSNVADCDDKCQKDFAEIRKVMIRALNEGREEEFDDMLASFYGVL
jgi:hypothetical protein